MATLRNTVAGANLTTALGGAPAANSDIIISEGSVTYNAGTDISTNEQNTFKVTRTFTGQLGTASSHVIVDLSAATYTGTLWYDGTNAVDAYVEAKTDIQLCIIIATGRGTYYPCGGTYTRLDQAAGKTEFGATCVLVTGNFLGGTTTIRDNATAVTTLNARDMTKLQIERAVTTGVFENCPDVVFDSYADAIATLTLENSTMKYNGGTITSYTGKPGGVLDLRWIVQNIAITDAVLHKGTVILYPNTGFTVTHTNAPTFVGGGPEWWQ